MTTNDTATDRPGWATDAMTDIDIEFLKGYVRAVEWLANYATPDELELHLRFSYEYNCFNDDGSFTDDGEVTHYSVGFAAALRIHRPCEAQMSQLTIEREIIDAQLVELSRGFHAEVDTEKAEVEQ